MTETIESLPKPCETKRISTFNVPHVLLKREEQNGFPVLEVRLGGSRQIEFTINITYSEQELDETSRLFVIKAMNKINFGDGAIRVLNDAVPGLAASAPTATEYMKNVGKRVMTAFSCHPDKQQSRILGRTVFRVARSTIILP